MSENKVEAARHFPKRRHPGWIFEVPAVVTEAIFT
jgi:hypothetical protein